MSKVVRQSFLALTDPHCSTFDLAGTSMTYPYSTSPWPLGAIIIRLQTDPTQSSIYCLAEDSSNVVEGSAVGSAVCSVSFTVYHCACLTDGFPQANPKPSAMSSRDGALLTGRLTRRRGTVMAEFKSDQIQLGRGDLLPHCLLKSHSPSLHRSHVDQVYNTVGSSWRSSGSLRSSR